MRLEEVSEHHERAFLAMMEDYAKNDAQTFKTLYQRKKPWSPSEYKIFLKDCEKARMDWRPKAGKVSETVYVLVDEAGEICGNGRMRFPLDDESMIEGGNLSFDVPPARRRQGFAALVLNRMLFEAVRAGLARVLVTCPSENEPALKAIRLNRAELENEVTSKKTGNRISRFWIRLR